jgi:hypothetical protein
LHRAWQSDPERLQRWLDEEFPAIQKLAKKETSTLTRIDPTSAHLI